MLESIKDLKENILLYKQKIDNEEDVSEIIRLKRLILEDEHKILDAYENKNSLDSTSDFKTLRDEVNSRPSVNRYSTGIRPLDDHLDGGIEVGSFVQLAGESFAGKTHLLLETLSNVAHNSPVMLFNFEMGERRITSRLEKSLLTEEAEKNFLINSKARELTLIITEIKNKAKDGVRFFGIDSKMKIEVKDEDTDLKAFRKISHELSKVAQQEELIIILINQMSDSDLKDKRGGLKGGNDQLYDADLVFFYWVDKKDKDPNNWVRTLQCTKNRQDEKLFSFETMLVDNNGQEITIKKESYEK